MCLLVYCSNLPATPNFPATPSHKMGATRLGGPRSWIKDTMVYALATSLWDDDVTYNLGERV